MLQGEGPLSHLHRHHISVTINTHTVLELQTKNNFSQLFITLNVHFYHSQQKSDIAQISFVLKKDPLQISQATGTTRANFLSNIYHHLRYLYTYAISGAGSTSFSRIIMVLIFVLMATAEIETETF